MTVKNPVHPAPSAHVAHSPPVECQDFPGGETAYSYRLAFNTFVILFLLLVCIGLANYLVWYLSSRS